MFASCERQCDNPHQVQGEPENKKQPPGSVPRRRPRLYPQLTFCGRRVFLFFFSFFFFFYLDEPLSDVVFQELR